MNCNVNELRILNSKVTREEIENKILNTDIIYIGGGNTRYMLEQWKNIEYENF